MAASGPPLILDQQPDGSYEFAEASGLAVSTLQVSSIKPVDGSNVGLSLSSLDDVPTPVIPNYYLQASGSGFGWASGVGGGGGANVKIITIDTTTAVSPKKINHNLGGKVLAQAYDASGNYMDIGFSRIDDNSMAVCFDQPAISNVTSELNIIVIGGAAVGSDSNPATVDDATRRYILLVSN